MTVELRWVVPVLGHERVLEIGKLCGIARQPLSCIPPAVLACAMETLEERARKQLGITSSPATPNH